MKIRSLLCTAIAASLFSSAGFAAEKGTIMILVNSLDNPYYASEAKGANLKAQELGYKTSVLSHGEDVKKQSELIDAAIGKKVQGIILDNADSTASVAAIKKAKEAGIPVVLINREIPVDDVALEQITHNNFQAGSDVATVFVEKMGEKGKYAELTCNLADNNCVTRSKSFHQVLDQYPDMQSVARQDAKGTLIDGTEFDNSYTRGECERHPDRRQAHHGQHSAGASRCERGDLRQRTGGAGRDRRPEGGGPRRRHRSGHRRQQRRARRGEGGHAESHGNAAGAGDRRAGRHRSG